MDILKAFIPNTFTSLSREEKEKAILNLVNKLCTSLHIDSIPVNFSNLVNAEGKVLGGKFIYDPLSIFINENFINNKEIDYLKNTGIDYNVANSYFLVTTIAHECYHYYQFTLEQKLINNKDIKENLKGSAYMYFVCLHDKLFSNYNKNIGIYSSFEISDEDIYLYSPVELSADGFAYQIIDILGKYDIIENFNQYKDFHSLTYFKLIQRNINNGGDLINKSINHSLKSALDFLNYKNNIRNSSTPYLGIDTIELEKQVIKASKKWKEKEKKEIDIYNKTTKKR